MYVLRSPLGYRVERTVTSHADDTLVLCICKNNTVIPNPDIDPSLCGKHHISSNIPDEIIKQYLPPIIFWPSSMHLMFWFWCSNLILWHLRKTYVLVAVIHLDTFPMSKGSPSWNIKSVPFSTDEARSDECFQHFIFFFFLSEFHSTLLRQKCGLEMRIPCCSTSDEKQYISF